MQRAYKSLFMFLAVFLALPIGMAQLLPVNAATWCWCTDYVGNRFNIGGYPDGGRWGDGYLQGKGFHKVSPAPGTIVVMQNSFPGISDPRGHVGVVKSIDSNGRMTVTGANQGYTNQFIDYGCSNVTNLRFGNASVYGRNDLTFWSRQNTSTPQPNTRNEFIEDNFNGPIDIDGDGDMDLMGISNAGKLFSWTQDANGKMNGQQYGGTVTNDISVWQDTSIHERLWRRDFEGDGDVDLVGLNNHGNIIVLRQNSNGSFGSWETIENITQSTYGWMRNDIHKRLWTQDFDGDGDMDIIAIRDDGYVVVWSQDSNGKFNGFDLIERIVTGSVDEWFKTTIHERFWMRDYEGDGDMDFIGIQNNGIVRIWTQDNNGKFNGSSSEQLLSSSIETWLRNDWQKRLWLEDFDGDGDVDFVGIDNNGKVVLWSQDADGKFNGRGTIEQLFQTPSVWFTNSIHQRVWLTDYDGDGDKDFTALLNNGGFIVWTQDSNGKFNGSDGSEVIVNSTTDWMRNDHHPRLWVTDYDGDGDTDVMGVTDGGSIIVWTRDSNGKFNGSDGLENILSSVFSWIRLRIHPRF